MIPKSTSRFLLPRAFLTTLEKEPPKAGFAVGDCAESPSDLLGRADSVDAGTVGLLGRDGLLGRVDSTEATCSAVGLLDKKTLLNRVNGTEASACSLM